MQAMTSTPQVAPIKNLEGLGARAHAAAQLATATGAAYITILLILQFARPDVSLIWQTTSEYARGPGGWVMVLAFLLSAVSYILLAHASWSMVRSIPGRIGAVLLVIAGIGVAAGGIFITDPIDTPQSELSGSGTVHGLAAGLALMLTPIAAIILNWGLARRAESLRTRTVFIAAGALPIAALTMFMVVQTVLLPADGMFGPDVPIGPAERVLVAAYAVWQIATSTALSRRSTRNAKPPAA